MLVVTIPGPMRGKQRPRISTRGGFARAYTPSETVNAEAWVKSCAIQAMNGAAVMAGPLRLSMAVGVPIPASWSKKKQEAARSGACRPTGKPDLDNVTKLVADALNGIAWRDDAEVVEMSLSKFYADNVFTTLTVEAI
ncbi:MAG: endodeoxyribonuclease RusA [Rhodoferax sp.]|nr:endodeoxyribonuclease RusA [Rhodoferax sp.]